MASKDSNNNLSRIDEYKTALQSVDRDQNQYLWAELQSKLAICLAEMNDSENIEQAIHHCHLALEVLTSGASPELWAETQQSLGLAFQKRITGILSENIEEAIFRYNEALQIINPTSDPFHWAMIQNNLSDAYRLRVEGEKSSNLEHAFKYCQLALRVYDQKTFPVQWASAEHNLANILLSRTQGNRAENIENALRHFELSLTVYNPQVYPGEWAKAHHALAHAYTLRIYGARAENVEFTIRHCQLAFDIYRQESHPDAWARVQFTLAHAYLIRLYGERGDNVEKASDHFRFALQIWNRNTYPDWWAATQRGLAWAFLSRVYGQRDSNVEQSIFCCKRALTVVTQEVSPIEWAKILNILANAYEVRLAGNHSENIEQAIYHNELALGVYAHMGMHNDLAITHHNLGNAYYYRETGTHLDNVSRAVYHFKTALEIYESNSQSLRKLESIRSLGHVYFNERDWTKALDAYLEAIETGNKLFAEAFSEAGRKAELKEITELYEQSAYCLIQLQRYTEALLMLEKGKVRLLTEFLTIENVDLKNISQENILAFKNAQERVRDLENSMRQYGDPFIQQNYRELAEMLHEARQELMNLISQFRNFDPNFILTEMNLADMLKLIPENGAFVIPIVTSQGSVIFVLPYQTEVITDKNIVRLDNFKDINLNRILFGYQDTIGLLNSYVTAFHNVESGLKNVSRADWKITLEMVTQYLWDNILEYVHQMLKSADIKRVIFIPSDGLQLLPLHAAWRMLNDHRVYFLEDYEIVYAPSIYIFNVCFHRAKEKYNNTALVLGINEYNELSPLSQAVTEARAVADQFKVKPLLNGDATKTTSIRDMQGKAYLHFSCHGVYAWGKDPLKSSLYLANDEPLTLLELLNGKSDLTSTKLVTLSACESGVIDIGQSPNEYVGFPAGFIQKGASAVLSTLWSVDESSTALLMERFYQNHLTKQMPFSGALREAQIWLRDITRQELGIYLKQKGTKEALTAYSEIMLEGDSTDKPYSHPFYWAAFTFFGA